MKLKGPFKLVIEMGYATAYDGNNLTIPGLSQLDFGWTTKVYAAQKDEHALLRDVVDLMNLGWEKYVDSSEFKDAEKYCKQLKEEAEKQEELNDWQGDEHGKEKEDRGLEKA